MRVWVAKWDNRPIEAYLSKVSLWNVILADISQGYLDFDDVEDDGESIYIDEWLVAHEVELIP